MPLFSRLLMILSGAALVACGGLAPNGTLKQVMDGDFFSNDPQAAAQAKQREDKDREDARQVPPIEDNGGVQMKIPF